MRHHGGCHQKYSKTIARVEKEMTMCLGGLESPPGPGLAKQVGF